MNAISNKIIASFIFVLTTLIFAQSPHTTWHTYNWADNIGEIKAYECGGNNYVFMKRQSHGDAWIFRLNNDGTVGDNTWKTGGWEKGIEAAATYTAGNNTYLILTNSENGKVWIITLTPDGKTGRFTDEKIWDKTIKEITTYSTGGKNYAILENYTNGTSMVYELTPDGKFGKQTYKARNKNNVVRAMATYESNGQNYLLKVSNKGKAWINKLTADGIIGEQTWETSSWQNRINVADVFTYDGMNHLLLSNALNGNFWCIELKGDGTVGKFLWSTNSFPRGIQGVTHYYINGFPYVLLTNTQSGEAWLHSGYQCTPQKLEDITGANNSPELNKLYDKLTATRNNLSGTREDVYWKSVPACEAAQNVPNSIGGINNKLNNYSEALAAFGKIPIIGTAATALRLTLNTSKTKVEKLQGTAENLNKSVVQSTIWNSYNATKAMNNAEQEIFKIQQKLVSLKKSGNAGSTNIQAITAEVNKLDSEINKIKKLSASVAKTKSSVDKFNSSVNNFSNKLKKVDNVVNNINKVLDKRFKKKILTKKISISVRDILTGGKVGKAIRKVAEKFAKKAIQPLVKKLNIKIPNVPAIDQLKAEMEKAKAQGEEMANIGKNINACANNLKKLN